MNSVAIAVVGAASLVVSADAGFTGFVAYAKQVGANEAIPEHFRSGDTNRGIAFRISLR